MGLLLMQFEYNRAVQKKTVLEHQGIRLNNKHELYTKRIGKITELFSKKKTKLESEFNQRNSQLTAALNRASASGSLFGDTGSTVLSTLCTGLVTTGLTALTAAFATDAAGITTDDSSTAALNKQKAEQTALVAQVQSYLQTVLNEMKEAALADLEEEEEQQTEPIAEKDTEMQAKIAVNDTLTTMADERAEKAKARLQQVTKDSVAHYGLS